MDGFLSWFFDFMTTMLGGVWRAISNFFVGLFQIINFPAYISQLKRYAPGFGVLDWILTILAIILTYAFWAGVVFLIVLLVRKYVRFRRSLVGNEDLLEEIADLHRDVMRLTREKEHILALQAGRGALDQIRLTELAERTAQTEEQGAATEGGNTPEEKTGVAGLPTVYRFSRLTAVDERYRHYTPPIYDDSMSLREICDDLRNYAASAAHLYYEIKTIRLMFAGLASTKLILLQGISGTGKTSLPYVMGKYFLNDATIASVQPSWRDRTELFGYFNEFTKKFNETDVLRRIYESSYNDEINIIVLDEMNIARVEYYFAEMLSILEMPNPAEWKIELVPSAWPGDPAHLKDGMLQIPQNIWYIGTANNDDSTFAVSDKVYDRAQVINLDYKGVAFDAPATDAKHIRYSYVEDLFRRAIAEHPVAKETLEKVARLDIYVIEKFRVAFGNRIMKQLATFLPVYVAAGGTELEGLDYLLATKVFRKFDALNLSLIRDEIKGLIAFLDNLFGKGTMKECIAYLGRLQKMY